MELFRQINKRILLLWSLLLCLALVCAQGVSLHIHIFDHDEYPHQAHAIDDAEHNHISKAHSAFDTSHNNSTASDIDIDPDGMLKNTSSSISAIAFISFFFTLIVFVSSRQLVYCRKESDVLLCRYYLISPPLRAPPLH